MAAASLHPALKKRVHFNKITCLYEIEEKGIKYGMPFNEFQFFKSYFCRHDLITNNSIERWYNQLDNQAKATITSIKI
jgi:hypothetical protein